MAEGGAGASFAAPAVGQAAAAPAAETVYGVGILPPPDIGEEIDRYRALYDGEFYPLTVPHITVKQTLRLLGAEPELLDRVRAVCRETAPFPVGIVGVNDFGHGGIHVVFLEVIKTPELMAFQNRLVAALRDVAGHSPLYTLEYELTRYLPHVTIGQRLTTERKDEVRAELAAEGYVPAYCFEVDRVSVARRDPDMIWRRPLSVHFGSGNVTADPYPEAPPWPRASARAAV